MGNNLTLGAAGYFATGDLIGSYRIVNKFGTYCRRQNH